MVYFAASVNAEILRACHDAPKAQDTVLKLDALAPKASALAAKSYDVVSKVNVLGAKQIALGAKSKDWEPVRHDLGA